MAVDFVAQLQDFRDHDARRDSLLAQLVKDFHELQARLNEATVDLQDEKKSRRFWQKHAEENESIVNEQKLSLNSNNFVVVLIDGDGALFQHELYRLGAEGGRRAASLLHSSVQDRLKVHYPDQNVSDWAISVFVMCNLEGLAKALYVSQILTERSQLTTFSQAFNLANPLFNYVDVGHGKEHADHKLRELLRFHLANTQCKHIYFAGCHDKGYIPVLEEYSNVAKQAARITLIETTKYDHGFARLGFKTAVMADLFSSTHLTSVAWTTSTMSNQDVYESTGPSKAAVAALPITAAPPLSQGTPPSGASYAAVGKALSATATVVNIAPTAPQTNEKYIYLNADDLRVDKPLPKYSMAAQDQFEKKIQQNGMNFCNRFHLTGNCFHVHCAFKHGPKLVPPILTVLKHKARLNACESGSYCEDVDCTSGHHCQHGSSCSYKKCFFPGTHTMSLEIAKRKLEDGRIERVVRSGE